MTYEPTMPEGALSWTSQVIQYADAPRPVDVPNVTHYAGQTSRGVVQCLLWWSETKGGRPMITGILNYYPHDMPPYEEAGNVNIWVRPSHQRQGIGTALYLLADSIYGPINLDQQRFTDSGAALANSLGRLSE